MANGLVAILLLPSLVLPLMSTVLDWSSFQFAKRILEFSVKNQGRYVVLSMMGSVIVVAVAATVYLAAFLLFTGAAEWAQPRSSSFKLIDPSLAARLLRSDPANPQIWWLYALMAFNLLPLLANICAATFGLLSWWTPRPLASKYAGYIRRGFKGDYPRLVETSAFLSFRAVLCVAITLVLITLTFLTLRYTFPNVVVIVADAFTILYSH